MQEPQYRELSTLTRHFCNIKHGISRNAELLWIFFLLRIHRGFTLWKQVPKTCFAYVPFVTMSISKLRKIEPYSIIYLKPADFHPVLTEIKASLHLMTYLNQKLIFSYISAVFGFCIFFVGHRCLLMLYSFQSDKNMSSYDCTAQQLKDLFLNHSLKSCLPVLVRKGDRSSHYSQ